MKSWERKDKACKRKVRAEFFCKQRYAKNLVISALPMVFKIAARKKFFLQQNICARKSSVLFNFIDSAHNKQKIKNLFIQGSLNWVCCVINQGEKDAPLNKSALLFGFRIFNFLPPLLILHLMILYNP